jgi:wobble nucleotide-excising tRNase
VFEDFAWPADLTSFKRFNLIYGWNGTGKTTVSEIFRSLEEHSAPSGYQVSLRVDGNELAGEAFPTAAVPVRVFNREFVRKSVFPEGGELPLILVLGKENVEKQKLVAKSKATIAELQKGLETAKQDARKADRAVEDFCTDKAATIKEALRATGSAYNNYDKRGFRQRSDMMRTAGDASAHLLSDAVREKTIAQHRGARRDTLTPLDYSLPDWNTLSSEASAVVGQTIEAMVIATLKDDQELSRWTLEGLELHEGRASGSCLFCSQPLPQHRLEELAAHFSTAFRDLEARVVALAATVDEHIRAIDAMSLPKRSELFDDMATDYANATALLTPALGSVRTALVGLREALEAKRQHPFETFTVAVVDPGADPSLIAAVNDVIRQHNGACAAFETRAVEARKKLEGHAVAEALTTFAARLSESATKGTSVLDAQAEITKLTEEVAEAEREIVQHRRPAEEFNEDLKSYLGHSELQLAIKETGYEVTRGGRSAIGLSEGERTAIALLYFLKSLEDRGFDLTSGVVVLDDPVSSLDTNSLFLAFGFIRSRLQHAGQLIVLTHNFSFFRQVRQWFHHLPKGQRKTAAFYMLEATARPGGRTTALCPLDPLLERYESEYHYLFARVLRDSQTAEATDLEGQYVLPNVARRLLEGFLAFRKPQAMGLEPKLMSMEGEEAKKLRVLRFLHVHSHGEALTEPEHDPSQLAEAPSVLRDMLDLIKSEDSKHYEAMVSLCGTAVDASEA